MIDLLITRFAAACPGGGFLGFPTWYKYLDSIITHDDSSGVDICTPKLRGLADIWLVLAAIIEILIRVAAVAAIAFIIWGGVQYITSQGEPEKTAQARKTIVNGFVGLVIAVSAVAVVTFIAGRFHP